MCRQTKPVNILLVEDSEIDRELFKIRLKECKITNNVYEAHSMNSALHFLQNADIHIDFIMSDIMLGADSGLDLLAAVKENDEYEDIPFAIMSGRDDAHCIARAAKLGADGYIIKPITHESINKLVQAINRLYWRIEISEAV